MNPWGIPETNSKRTLELREVIAGGVDLWAFEYPSYYQGEARKEFEQKVTDHFLFRQIGAETVGRFVHYFRQTVREIMPYYIQRYESVDLMKDPEIRPLDNYNMIEEYDQESTGTSSEKTDGKSTTSGENSSFTSGSGTGSKTGTSSNKGTNVHSDTPGNTLNLSINLDADGVETLSHASDTQQEVKKEKLTETSMASETSETSGSMSDSSETSGTRSGSETGTQKHRLTRRGNIGVTTYAQLLEGYRETFLNIDMEIIGELETCFLGVY